MKSIQITLIYLKIISVKLNNNSNCHNLSLNQNLNNNSNKMI